MEFLFNDYTNPNANPKTLTTLNYWFNKVAVGKEAVSVYHEFFEISMKTEEEGTGQAL